MALSRTYRYT